MTAGVRAGSPSQHAERSAVSTPERELQPTGSGRGPSPPSSVRLPLDGSRLPDAAVRTGRVTLAIPADLGAATRSTAPSLAVSTPAVYAAAV